jgi:hypothetical protein
MMIWGRSGRESFDGEEHRFLHLGLGVGGDEEIHRPIRLILIHHIEPRDRDVMGSPLRGGELRGRVDRPVRDQREQDTFDIGREPAPAEHRRQCGVDTELAPQPVEEPGDTDRT